MVNIARNSGNWDAKFYNVTYAQSKEIAKDKNVKEVSIVHKKGVSESVINTPFGTTKIDLREYDKNALNNLKLDLLDGRLPINSSEIVIQKREGDFLTQINEKITLTINNEEKEYTVVGLAKEIDFNKESIGNSIYAAITFMENTNLEDNAKCDISIITNNVRNTYKTVKDITSKLGTETFKEKVEDKKERF